MLINHQKEKENSNRNIIKKENMIKETRMENRRKVLLEKILEIKEENKLIFKELDQIQNEIINNCAEIEVLENYNKIIDNLGSGVSNLKRMEMIRNIKRKNTECKEALFSAATDLQREVIQREKLLNKLKSDNDKYKLKKEELRNKSEDNKKKIKTYKEEMDGLRNKLLLHYHYLLSDGKDTRTEGLVWIIKSIWNLGQNVIMTYLPSYLDEKCINFLFSIAHKDFELLKMKEELEYAKLKLKNTIGIFSENSNILKSNFSANDLFEKKFNLVIFLTG